MHFDGRQLQGGEERRKQQEGGGKKQVGHLDRACFGEPQRVELLRRRVGGGDDSSRQDQRRTEHRGQRRAERVEGLGQGQAARGRIRRTKHGHVRVGRNLQQRDAACQHEESTEEQRIDAKACRRDEQRAADGGDDEAEHDPPFVADALDERAGGQRDDEIGAEEAELDQHRLRVVEREDVLQMRDQNVVQARDEAPHEEQ
ncbi:hypothetical protein D9M70_515560 [compost metagenome]